MAKELRLQDPGEGIHEAQIQDILVEPGESVEEGQTLLVVETDKAAVEVPSPYDGRVDEILVSPHERVRVGDVLMRFDGEGEAAKEADRRAPEGQAEEPATRPERGRAEAAQEDHEPAGETAGAETAEDTEPAATGAAPGRPVPATPATRRVARELDVDLREVAPSGGDGRVTEADVRAHAEAAEPAGARTEPTTEEPARRMPLEAVKRATARQMARAWREIPHVTHADRVDITELERFRRRHHAEVEAEGGKLTVTAFALKALAATLQAFPTFNARFDGEAEELVLLERIDIGVALDSERGLIVPVVRAVDRKSVVELAREVVELADRLRGGAPAPAELEGGTFTLTNVGAFGGTGFAPLVNPPQVAILGLARARLEPVVEGTLDDPETATRLVLPVVLAFDHRANDGADAARFVNHVARLLRSPETLALRT
jgi:pyruvate dehydrogenase E2 component (dihydrolipoamide acetyltransferase)